MSMVPLLHEVETWLAQNAPRTLAALPESADDARIAEAERELGLVIHDDVRTLVKWHNGSDEAFDLAPGYFLLSLREMVDAARVRGGAVAPPYPAWQGSWWPIASDGCGAHLVVDGSGAVLLSDPEDGMAIRESWPSVPELVRQTLTAMREGGEFLDSRCFVDDGRLVWDEA